MRIPDAQILPKLQASPVMIATTLPADKRCLVAICHNGPVVTTETAQSLMELGWGNRVDEAKLAHGFAAIDFAWSRTFPRVDSLRDWIVAKALDHPSGYTHVLMLDADMVWPTDVLIKMLRHHDRDILSGLYCIKGGNHAPVAMLNGHQPDGRTTTHYHYDLDYREGREDVREVELVGLGCTLIRIEVFKALARPWFYYENDDDGWPRVSEDVPFCREARKAGFRVWWDRSVKCGHVTTKTITEAWHIAATDGALAGLAQAVSR
jgi:GT2 family glycosyltransferase